MLERVPIPTDTRAPTGETNAYLVGEDPLLLVDPGGAPDTILDAIGGRRVAHVALTHHHRDHHRALAPVLDRLTETQDQPTVWARHGRTAAFEAATGVAPDRPLAPGTVIQADGIPVRAVDTPGHAAEHLAFATPEGWLTGDLAVARGSVVVGGDGADMRAYLTSLRRVRASTPARLYPGHGPVIEDVAGVCERLIRHRLQRERNVMAAVEGGARSVDDVLDRAYDKDLTGVRDLARWTVVAHLEKLAREGAVVVEGDAVRPA